MAIPAPSPANPTLYQVYILLDYSGLIATLESGHLLKDLYLGSG
jgi:hypothetical protein